MLNQYVLPIILGEVVLHYAESDLFCIQRQGNSKNVENSEIVFLLKANSTLRTCQKAMLLHQIRAINITCSVFFVLLIFLAVLTCLSLL